MTKKDYLLIARTISHLDEIVDQESLEAIGEVFANALSIENPKFDRERFLHAAKFTSAHFHALMEELGVK